MTIEKITLQCSGLPSPLDRSLHWTGTSLDPLATVEIFPAEGSQEAWFVQFTDCQGGVRNVQRRPLLTRGLSLWWSGWLKIPAYAIFHWTGVPVVPAPRNPFLFEGEVSRDDLGRLHRWNGSWDEALSTVHSKIHSSPRERKTMGQLHEGDAFVLEGQVCILVKHKKSYKRRGTDFLLFEYAVDDRNTRFWRGRSDAPVETIPIPAPKPPALDANSNPAWN